MSLPSGYTKLKYVRSTGAQAIFTGVSADQDTRVVIDFQMTGAGTGEQHICSVRSGSSGPFFTAFYNSSLTPGKYRVRWASQSIKSFTMITSTDRMVLRFNKSVATLVNQTVSFTAATFSISYPLTLFCRNTAGTCDAYAYMDMYSCQIYSGSTLVRDYIPCKNSSGVAGLWDDVESMFYGSGTPLEAGPEDTSGDTSAGSHSTLINGTKYSIIGGRTLIGGTGYGISKGRTLVGGTGYDIAFAPPYDPVFANNTWEQIIEACHNNAVPDTWKVADQKPMTINGVDYQIDIIGKNHDTYASGGKAPLTFQLHDCYADTKQMNSSHTNSGGWTSCAMRQTHLPAILALMPTEVQNGIREVNKLTSAGRNSSTINTTADKLFLLSEIEIFGSVSYSKRGEGTQYDYYKAGNSKVKNRNGSTSVWLERSPCGSDSTIFCSVSRSGDASLTNAGVASGVAFGFCF